MVLLVELQYCWHVGKKKGLCIGGCRASRQCRAGFSKRRRTSSGFIGEASSLHRKPPVCLPNGLLIELPYCWRVHELKGSCMGSCRTLAHT
jgi:hypothetical protein